MSKIFSAFFAVSLVFSAFGSKALADDDKAFLDKTKIFWEDISDAIEGGDLERVIWTAEFFADMGVSLNILRDEDGRTPLHKAVSENQKPIIHYLSKAFKGALVNQADSEGLSPLHLALRHRNPEEDVIKFLVAEGGASPAAKDKSGRTALHLLVSRSGSFSDGGLGLARQLVSKGAPVNEADARGDIPLHSAIKERRTPLVEFFISETETNLSLADQRLSSPLHLIISYYDDREAALELIKGFVSRGANVNAQDESGNTPLHLALIEGHFPLAEFLIGHAEANLSLPGKKGLTPLQMAILYGDGGSEEEEDDGQAAAEAGAAAGEPVEALADESAGEPVEALADESGAAADSGETAEAAAQAGGIAYALLARGAPVNDRAADGSAALHFAIIQRKWDLAMTLIDKGADVKIKNKDKRMTPLHLACVYGAPLELREALVAKGASVNRKSRKSRTCAHLAVQEGDLEILKWLDARGAGLNAKTDDGYTPFALAEDVEIIVYLGRRLKEMFEKQKAAKKAAAKAAEEPASASAPKE